MSYRIDYQATKKVRGAEKLRSPGAALVCILLILLILCGIPPQGREVLRSLLIPGDAAVTVAALETLAGELRSGTEVQTALDGFCRQVTDLD